MLFRSTDKPAGHDSGDNTGGKDNVTEKVKKQGTEQKNSENEKTDLIAFAAGIEDNRSQSAEEAIDIADPEIPKASDTNEKEGSLALINLIAALLAAAGAAVTVFRNKGEDEEGNNSHRKTIAGIIGAVAAIASVAVLLLTGSIGSSVTIADKWTLLMAALLATQIGSAVFGRK